MKTKGIYFLYRILQALALPGLFLYLFIRGARNKAYFTSLRQRLGLLPRSFKQTVPGAIWLHAVSVGEVLSTLELARRLRAEFPRAPLFVSTATIAGQAAAREKLAGVATGVFYAPIDHIFAVRSVLRTLQPMLVLVVETEIWPNLFREAKRAGCGLAIVNGRISDRTEGRYRRHRWFFREVMRWPDAVLVQSETMRDRYLAMGAPAGRVYIGGNLKYDFIPRALDANSPVLAFLENTHAEKVWIAASTMPPARAGDVDEDDAVIEAFRQLAARRAGLLLVLAPRKPERFDTVGAKLAAAGIRFARRSQGAGPIALPGVLLLDSIGELSGLFALADVVFMGGTLADRGGHNILEPAFFAKPVICGPHMENFREVAEEFRARGASVEISGARMLAAAVEQILNDPAGARELGGRAVECAESKRGSTERTLAALRQITADSWTHFRQPLPALLLLWPVSQIWRWVSAWNFARNTRRKRRLEASVISVGNITMGGTGKTPMVLYLAGQMRKMGHNPGILTRGYGRHSLHKRLILQAGECVKTTQTGDEPQIFLRSGVAPVGIGADRFETGRLLAERFGLDLLILDDGFQHARLERLVDIVLVDALEPFGGSELFPLGRLREPLRSLERADIIVITRSDAARAPASVEHRLRLYNKHAPVFLARSLPQCWIEEPSGREFPTAEPPFSRAGAFCGLGNPEAFWSTLRTLGIDLVDCEKFSDHHEYRPDELRRLARQFAGDKAEAAATTEKDAVKLTKDLAALMAPLPLYWLKIGVEIERESEFLDFIERRLCARARVYGAPAR